MDKQMPLPYDSQMNEEPLIMLINYVLITPL